MTSPTSVRFRLYETTIVPGLGQQVGMREWHVPQNRPRRPTAGSRPDAATWAAGAEDVDMNAPPRTARGATAWLRVRRTHRRVRFGGSVAALRAAEKGYRVGVMESGKRWNDEDIPNSL